MPAVSARQRRFMYAELARKRAGQPTQTGMTTSQLEDFTAKPPMKPRDVMSRSQRSLIDRSTQGSAPFTHPEFKVGYRKITLG